MGITYIKNCCSLEPQEQPQRGRSQKVLNQRKIGFEDFVIEGKLGEGGFGSVFLGQLRKNMEKGITQKYAIKMVSKKKLRQKHLVQNALDQKYIAMYYHDFIASLIMCFQDQYYIFMVLQFASAGDTYSLIKRTSPKFQDYKKLGQKAVRFIAACVILGIEFLHSNDYIYRDLKPENVLLFQDGYVKLSDFGLAKKSTDDQVSKTFTGTPLYYSPEMVLGKGYNKKIDIWALGVYLYEMSNYDPPFTLDEVNSPPKQFLERCLKAEKERVWTNPQTSQQLKDLINRLLICDQSKRIGANGWQQIKSHPFFKNFNWKQLSELKMQSPLKNITRSYPTKLKQFKQDISTINREKAKIEGWSYYGKYL